jgi:hypothetical protein
MTSYLQYIGKRVCVVIEGVLNTSGASPDEEYEIVDDAGEYEVWFTKKATDSVSVGPARTRPPVVFKPGQIIRSLANPQNRYALAQDGYLNLFNGLFLTDPNRTFTSKYYEEIASTGEIRDD